MRVSVDQARCQGNNRCAAIAYDLFEIDDAGHSHPFYDGLVPAGREEAAVRAAANCPEDAITISENEDTEGLG